MGINKERERGVEEEYVKYEVIGERWRVSRSVVQRTPGFLGGREMCEDAAGGVVGGESPSYMWHSHSATGSRSSHVWPTGRKVTVAH